MIDATVPHPGAVYATVRREIKQWDPHLLEKPEIIAISKADLLDEASQRRLYAKLQHLHPVFISSATGRGLNDLVHAIDEQRARPVKGLDKTLGSDMLSVTIEPQSSTKTQDKLRKR